MRIETTKDLFDFLSALDAETFPLIVGGGGNIIVNVDYTNTRVLMFEQTTLLEK